MGQLFDANILKSGSIEHAIQHLAANLNHLTAAENILG